MVASSFVPVHPSKDAAQLESKISEHNYQSVTSILSELLTLSNGLSSSARFFLQRRSTSDIDMEYSNNDLAKKPAFVIGFDNNKDMITADGHARCTASD